MQRDSLVHDELLDILDLAQAFVRDLDGTIRFWSTGASRLYGWTAEETVGCISHEVLQTQFPEPLAKIHQTLLDRGSWRGELVHLARSGERVSVASEWTLYKGVSSGTVEVIEVNHNITELKEAHRELARLRQANKQQLGELGTLYQTAKRLSAIVESSNDAIISKSLDGNVTSWNAGAEKLFGYHAEEVLGKPLSVISEPQRVNSLPDALDSVEESVHNYETRGRRKDGRLIDISLTISPIYDSHGRMWGTSNTARDVTDKKRAERKLLNSNEELRQFAFAAAHDLQEPIRNISLYAQLIVKRSGGLLDKQSQDCTEVILNSARRMQGLVRDLLVYTKATAGPEVIQPAESRLALDAAIESLQPEIAQCGAVLSAPNSMPQVLMHESHLTQLFSSLISNAIKYRGARVPRVDVFVEQAGRECTFSIRDNGIGIERQHWARIFGVFKRLHGSEVPGTGIGLAVCQRIVQHYGGRLWVDSIVGQGSTFYFTAMLASE